MTQKKEEPEERLEDWVFDFCKRRGQCTRKRGQVCSDCENELLAFITKTRMEARKEERVEWFENVIKDYDRLLTYKDHPEMLVRELTRYREAMSEQYNEEKTVANGN
jgi:hypothetical protein